MTPTPHGIEVLRNLRDHYRSDTDSLGDDFFKPCLAHATRYRRAAGYFSSSALLTWSAALPRALEVGDLTIQLLVSPNLTASDISALSSEYSESRREDYLQGLVDRLVKEIDAISESDSEPGRLSRLFARLVVGGVVQMRIAIPDEVDSSDLFHEKFGIFDFPNGTQVAFSGSANETVSGHYRNFESVDVFRSWVDGDARRVATKAQQFDEAWANETRGLMVIGLAERALERLRIIADREARSPEGPSTDLPRNHWGHQDEAIAAFMRNQAGILEMATGTGKTRTALRILVQLIQDQSLQSAVVSTDGTDLLEQWRKEVDNWLLKARVKWPVYRQYAAHHEAGTYLLDPSCSILLVSRSQLPGIISRLPDALLSQMLIVHDEVHGFGIPSVRNTLGPNHSRIAWRLGLSATPERAYDEAGNAFIAREIGQTIFRFPLEAAIDRGILTGFDYVPLHYELTDGDRRRLADVFARQAARSRTGQPMSREELWTELSKVYKTAEEKPAVFRAYLREHPEVLNRCIIFVETTEYGSRILDDIHSYTTRYRTYYADDEQSHLLAFARGEIDVLITCHRISQGIDIRSVQSVVLFSSARSKLETIQRIGRCLRVDPANPNKRARVVDFVRPAEEGSEVENADQARSAWLSGVAEHPKEQR